VVPLAAGAVLAAAGVAAVVAVAGTGLLAAGAVVAALPLAAGATGGAVLLPLLSWLQAASASRAAHRNGRRFNMAYLERVGPKSWD
jgi:hypothetical protein